MGHIHSVNGTWPKLAGNVFVAPGAAVIGRVTIGPGSSVWYNSIVRGDSIEIIIGEETNIQDNTTLHGDPGPPLTVGNRVTIGHNCVLHGCYIGDGVTIGMGSIILDKAEIGAGTLLAAGSLVPPGKKIPPRVLAVGSPVKVVRELSDEEVAKYQQMYRTYRDRAQRYIAEYAGRKA